MTRIVFISDTHNKLDSSVIPDGDILIHAGDATMTGTTKEILKFDRELGKLPHKYKVFSPGNHDLLFEREPAFAKSLIRNARVYIHEPVVLLGIKMWFSPYQPRFCNWAFNLSRGEQIRKKWEQISDDTEILITHGPPNGILDKVASGENLGCEELANVIVSKLHKLKYHVFGHIHEGYGRVHLGEVSYINASLMNGNYKLLNAPHIVDI